MTLNSSTLFVNVLFTLNICKKHIVLFHFFKKNATVRIRTPTSMATTLRANH